MKLKIIATIGPSSNTKEKILAILSAGANILRINAAHTNEKEMRELIDIIEELRKRVGEIPVFIDVPGPKIRTGRVKEPIKIEESKTYIAGEGKEIPIRKEIVSKFKAGEIIRISDGKLSFKCISNNGKEAELLALNSGTLLSEQSINSPSIKYKKSITKEDIKIIKLGKELGVEIFGLSFLSTHKELEKIKRMFPELTFISKIETSDAINDLEKIIKLSDIVMVARGDLALNIKDMFELPYLQKKIIMLSNVNKKPVIVATQMLSSMVNSPVPTRAEISDIYTAIEEGADALMLSEETAIGKYPIKAVATMKKIAESYESKNKNLPAMDIDDELAKAAVEIAKKAEIKDAIALTRSGATAMRISSLSDMAVTAITNSKKTYNKLLFARNVTPIISKLTEKHAFAIAKEREIDRFILLGGDKDHPGSTTYLRIVTIKKNKTY
jgi:pyruvate kinase